MRYILVFAFAASLAAQQKIAETIEVRVANVDVVVTDRAGHVVRGLTKDDFELLENGKPQTITNFYEASADQLPTNVQGAAATAPAKAADAAVDVRPRRFVVVFDNYSLEPMQRNSVITALRKFINTNMRPTDEMSVIVWARGTQIVTPLTNDKAAVLRGVDSIMSRSRAGMTAGQEDERARQQCRDLIKDVDEKDPDASNPDSISRGGGQSRVTYRFSDAYAACDGGIQAVADSQWANARALIGDMRTVISTFAGVDGRKVLVFAGALLPEHPGRQSGLWLMQTFQPYEKLLKAQKIQFNPNKPFGEAGSRSQTLSIVDLAKFANANGVTFYTIDADDTRDSVSAEKRLADDGTDVHTESFMAFTDTASAYHALASITGGASLSNTQNFDAAFEVLNRDLNTFYSLGYKPSADIQGERSITVRVKKSGMYARARKTYTPKNADDDMNDRVIANVMHHGAGGEWPVHLTAAAPTKEGDLFKLPVTIELDPKLTLLPDEQQKLVGGFTLYIVVGTPEGAMSKVTKAARKIEVPKEAEADFRSKPMKYTLMLSVRPGDNIVSVGVADQISNATGFDRVDVAAK